MAERAFEPFTPGLLVHPTFGIFPFFFWDLAVSKGWS